MKKVDAAIERLKREAEAKREKVVRLALQREKGWLYELLVPLQDSDQWRVVKKRMKRAGEPSNEESTTAVTVFRAKRDPKYLYQLDVDGDISRIPRKLWDELSQLRQERDSLE
jgi:hypothetical protein